MKIQEQPLIRPTLHFRHLEGKTSTAAWLKLVVERKIQEQHKILPILYLALHFRHLEGKTSTTAWLKLVVEREIQD